MNYEHTPSVLQWGVVIGASLLAVLTDLRSRRIPNLLTLPLFVAGLAVAALAGGWTPLVQALLAGFIVGLPFVLLFAFAGGGAGDAKLMIAIGVWLGPFSGVIALASVTITGALFAILHACAHRNLRPTLARVLAFPKAVLLLVLTGGSPRDLPAFQPATTESHTIPYAVAIFMGTVFAAVYSFTWINS